MPNGKQNIDTLMPIQFVQGLVRAAAMSGISVDEVLKSEGINLDKMTALSISKLAKVINYLIRKSPVTTIFPLVRVFNDEAINEMLAISSTSKNLVESAKNMMISGPFSALGLEISYHVGEECDTYEVASSYLEGMARIFLVEICMAASLRFLPAQFHGLSVIEKVEFDFEREGNQSEYELYFGCPVEFNQSNNRIYFKKNTVTADILSQSPGLLANAMDVLQEKTDVLLSLQGYRFRVSQVVKNLVRERIQSLSDGSALTERQDFSIENVASRIGLNVRSLQRKLKQEDISYVECKNQMLIEESKKWIDEGQTNLDLIAETFGYSDRAAFSKVFKKYTQMWPAQYRSN